MDTTPARGPTETPRMDRINPPAMEKSSKRRQVDGVKSKNGKKPIQQPVNQRDVNEIKDTGHKKDHAKNNPMLRCVSWNIRRGVWKQEMVIKLMLHEEIIDVLFLVETDTKSIKTQDDYKIEGYSTYLQNRESPEDMVRVIAIVDEETGKNIKVREDLMSEKFPSIWLKVARKKEEGVLLGGFYREWTRNEPAQKKTN